jgi:hypothetical protein
MAVPSCEEYKAIYQELLELVEISRRTKPGPDATLQQLAAWFDERDQDQDYGTRVRTALSALKRRLIEHQKLTGHRVPVPYPPGGLGNWN